MVASWRTIKSWSAPLAAIGAVILTGAYAYSKQTSAAADIREMLRVGSTLSDAARQGQNDIASPRDSEQLDAQRLDLEHRMEESGKPGMIQAELMASARKAGLDVREVQPTSSPMATGKAAPQYPCHRVSVQGGYSQIAEYMQLCKAQRVPARPIGFRVNSAVDESGRPAKGLRAEITMESFQPRLPDKPATPGM